MNTTTPNQRRTAFAFIIAGVLFALVSTNAPARDTDIYFTDPSASGLKPNVLLILDTSGSMNEYVSNGMSRIDHMKQAMKTIIDESTNINLGVMRFSRGQGAAVIYPLSDLDADVPDDGNLIAAMQNSADDAYESSSGTVTTTETTHTFQSGRTVGIRFSNVYIPKGATITSAYVTLIASSSNSNATSMTISADASDNAPAYTAVANDITSRVQTAAVAWATPAWTNGARYYSPDISAVVKTIVDRSGWQSGNAMAFQFTTASGTRIAYAYDRYVDPGANYESFFPKLVVKYDSSGVGGSVTCNKTAVARVNLGTDDAEERANGAGIGGMTTAQTNSNPIQLTKQGTSNEQYVGVRFQNIQVPQGATIVSAEMDFRIRTTNSAAASLIIDGQASDSATTFTGTAFNISNTTLRPRTSSSVSVPWNSLPNPAAGQPLTTPSLTGIVSEIVNRTGWASGNAMAFFIKAGAASGPRNVEAFETSPGRAPFLRITYQASCAARKARDEIKAAIVAMSAGGSTPIVDALYEGALYFRGDAADYGKARENGTSGTNTYLLRVSHSLSYSPNNLSQPTGCSNADLEADACITEQITGNVTYKSPVTAGCQSNHMVLLTDGAATANNSKVKVRTMTGAASCSGSGFEDCGVTLTTYLANSDQFSAYVGTQPIYTHTVGFNISNTFLSDLASTGKGSYQTVNNADELTDAFREILNQVLSDPTGFVSPSLTVNAFNRLYDQDDVYFSVFSPQLAVGWPGNVKKYRLCDKGESCLFGEVVDANDDPAIDTNTSKIKGTAQSFWSSSPDGPTVDLGGAGAKVPAYTAGTRKVYTYTGTASTTDNDDFPASAEDLTLARHVVSQAVVGTPDNAALSKTLLGNASMTDQEYYDTIRWMRGQDVQDDDSNGSTTDNRWKFTDALHSRPATVTYGGTAASPVSKLFVGTNDGGLRMINTSNDATTGGQEEWIVYLPEFLPKMKSLMDNNSGEHIIGLDGASSVWVVDNDKDGSIEPGGGNNDKVYLYIGMRRGGRDVYALDVTPDSGPVTTPAATGEIKPKFLWRIKGGGAGDYAELGQTWSYPAVATIRVKCASGDTTCDDSDGSTLDSKKKTVLIFGGGYDPAQDGVMPAGADSMGNGIYIVDPLNGSLVWRVGGTGSGAPLVMPEMKYSIPSDVGMLDSNGDGAVDRLYVGDMRGQVFRIDLSNQIDPSASTAALRNGGTSGFVFADIGCTGGVRSNNCSATDKFERRKFFYAPAIVQTRDSTYSSASDYDIIAIASGDREDPLDKITKALSIDEVHNRIYAFRDYNYPYGSPGTTSTLSESDLYNSTSNALQDPSGTGYSAALTDIKAADGWYVDLAESGSDWIGEKGLSHPTVFSSVLYVTTYIPPSGGPVVTGTCPPPAEGSARLYGLNYLSGAGIIDLNGTTGIDRYVDIGGGIPSEIVVVSREGGTTAIVGTSGGASIGGGDGGGGCTPPFCFPFPDDVSRIPTFWHDD
ncbi:MAG: VWA domain-containing protein [Sulfuricaulis sp.]|uniref:VWA domain-containing protein n=1 Tax=Sulfuricaulis sp. TaxID=2003553 RepID=UPI0025CBFC1F|nr:VWA domain-containing protein [Sulfuricaulis sp.]MCR4346805.1 VWA domain-containing protein [Sulfuricaulis sp.]